MKCECDIPQVKCNAKWIWYSERKTMWSILIYTLVIFLSMSGAGVADYIGTGFFYNSRGDMLTNKHVIEGCAQIKVQLPNKNTISGDVIAKNGVLISRPYKQIFKQTNFQPFRLKKYPLIPTEAVDVFTYGYSFDKRGFNE